MLARTGSAKTLAAAAALSGLVTSGCNLVFGIEELPVKTDGSGGSSSSSSSSQSSTSTATQTTCMGGEMACGSACVDPTSDGHHCGACGHDCLGGDCAGAKCQPVVLAGGLKDPHDIAVAGQTVYVGTTFGGEILKIPLSGGQPVTLSTDTQSPPIGVAAAGNKVFWATTKGAVMAVPTTGGVPAAIASGQGQLAAVAANGTHVYWVSDTAVTRAPVTGGGPQGVVPALPPNQGPGAGMTLDAGFVYWTYSAGAGAVFKAPLGGGSASTVASGQSFPNAVAVDAVSVYWVDGGPGPSAGSLMKMPLGGGQPQTLSSGDDNPVRMVADKDHLYWVDQDGGVLKRASLDGAAPEVLASGQHPYGLALEAKSVVWTFRGTTATSADGMVMRLAK